MSAELIRRMRAAREQRIDVGEFHFTVRRPTDLEAQRMAQRGLTECEAAQECVVGWSGIKESDIVKGAASDDAAFSPALWSEWCADRPDFWTPVNEKIKQLYKDHKAKQEQASKN